MPRIGSDIYTEFWDGNDDSDAIQKTQIPKLSQPLPRAGNLPHPNRFLVALSSARRILFIRQ